MSGQLLQLVRSIPERGWAALELTGPRKRSARILLHGCVVLYWFTYHCHPTIAMMELATMNQTSIKREMVATCITPLHSPIETQVDEGLQGTIPAINSCVRLCISLHGSGSTILMPGFHSDSCGLFCPLGQNMRWSSRFRITDLRCPLCNCVLRDFPVTSLPFAEIY